MKSKFIDISLTKSQNNIAVQAASCFSIEELEKINLTNISYPERREITSNCEELYHIDFGSGVKIQLLDILMTNLYPIARFTCIRISTGNSFQIDIKCKHSKKNIKYLNLIIAKAINFKNYKYETDNRFVKKNIIDNFCNEISSITTVHILEEIRFLVDFLSADDTAIYNDDFDYSFDVDNITVKLESVFSNNIIKFSILGNTDNIYMYFQKDKIGISSIQFIIEKVIQDKKSSTP